MCFLGVRPRIFGQREISETRDTKGRRERCEGRTRNWLVSSVFSSNSNISQPRNPYTDVVENLLSSENTEISNDPTCPSTMLNDNGVSRSFATNIDELNLLGESGESEEVRTRRSSKDDTCAFRIDELNL